MAAHPGRLDRPESLSETGSPDEFGRIYDIALGPDQSVYVADEMNHEVRVFGVDGVHRFTFGRQGEGPGEFGRLFSVAWLGDRLLTLDALLGRISEFSAGGEYLGQRRVRGAMGGPPGWVRFYPVGADEAYRVTPAANPGSGRWWEFIGVDSRAETGDTLLLLEGPSATMIDCEHGDRVSFFEIPFGTRLVQRPGPGGVIYSAMTDAYRIALTGADDEIDIAYDGNLWVEVIRMDGNRWEVFDPSGRLLASLPAPPRGHLPPAIGTDHVLIVRRGEFDLEYVDVWRIDRGRQ